MNFGRKGDVNRYILYSLIILILIVVIVALFFGGLDLLLRNLFINEVLN